MHISEGVLSLPVLVSGGGLTLTGLAFGIRRLATEDIPKTALLTAAFFLASLVHVPLGPSSVHLILNGLLGILLGWAAFPAIFAALVLQAVLFQFGGLTTLGVNTFVMSAPAVLFGLPVRWLLRRKITSVRIILLASGAAGALSVLGSGLLAAAFLAISGEAFYKVAQLILLAHVPIAGLEAVISSLSIAALLRMRPEMILPAGTRLVMISLVLVSSLVLSAVDAEAHRVNVFAWESGDSIEGEVYFADGSSARGARIEAVCPDGRAVYDGLADDKGTFSFSRPSCPSIRITADAGAGHLAHTILEFAVASSSAKGHEETARPQLETSSGEALTARVFEAILDERLEPIRREIAHLVEREDRVRPRDVFAGLGYIAGAAGLALYLASRRKSKSGTP